MGELGNVGMKKDTVPKSVKKRTLPENCKGASRKGIPNKITKQLKDMILGALDDAGGQQYLARQAEENPGAFLALIGKVLPITLISNADDQAPAPVSITFNIVDSSAKNADTE